MGKAKDTEILDYARKEGMVVATKASGFGRFASAESGGAKVIWVRTGNCSTARVEDLFRRYAVKITDFAASASTQQLVLL